MRRGAAFAEPGWRVGTFGPCSFSVLTISLMMMMMMMMMMEMPLLCHQQQMTRPF